MTILGVGKYHDYVISHSKNLKSKKSLFLDFIAIFFQDDRLEHSKEFGPFFFKIR
jgi:hypothetical protein